METVTVTVGKWAKYNVRNRDYTKPWWMSVSNQITEDPDIYKLTDAEFRAWIHILSVCSRKKSDTVEIDFADAKRIAKVESKAIVSLIAKFSKKSILSRSGQELAEVRPESGPHRTEQNNTEQNRTLVSTAPTPTLLDIWNENCGTLAKAKSCGPSRLKMARARWKEKPDVGYWAEVTRKLAGSDFCNGKGKTGWKATFDFFIKPETHNKALEGTYDNGGYSKSKVQYLEEDDEQARI